MPFPAGSARSITSGIGGVFRPLLLLADCDRAAVVVNGQGTDTLPGERETTGGCAMSEVLQGLIDALLARVVSHESPPLPAFPERSPGSSGAPPETLAVASYRSWASGCRRWRGRPG